MGVIMAEKKIIAPGILRTERGLTIAGTRTTIYEVLDYLKADWPSHLIRHWLLLTQEQLDDALRYIDANRADVEAEYQLVLQEAEETRAYWEAYNRERRERIARTPPRPGREALYELVQARKAELDMK
jgi:uncharacterized protein (DUF433 family)